MDFHAKIKNGAVIDSYLEPVPNKNVDEKEKLDSKSIVVVSNNFVQFLILRFFVNKNKQKQTN